MQLVGEPDGVKEFYRIGADVDAGAELDEFGRLLVDLHFESLPAERDGRRQPAKPRSDNRNPTRASHSHGPRHETLDRNAHGCHPDGRARDALEARPSTSY
jgi:hypothetical protein